MNKIMKYSLLFIGIICIANTVQAKIHSEIVDYEIDGLPFQGYLSYDDEIAGTRPGILVVHEWWGHNAYARKRADMLAKQGYTAFALDMYGTGKLASHPDDAKKFMQAVLADLNASENRFNVAKRLLQTHPTVDASKMAAIGYCFGGGTVLHMARKGSDLAGVVSFHGSLSSNIKVKAGQIKSKILVFNGADDPFVPIEQVVAFKQEMNSIGANFEFINYPGVKHSFTNWDANKFGKEFNMPLVYDSKADKDSWHRMNLFFKKIFNQ